jgi:predicted DNA-binding protein YlxM (UPF0122 family)
MTDKQQEFLRLYTICELKYDEISERLDVPKTTISVWFEELKSEREQILKIKTIWRNKKITKDFEHFYNWYLALERKCTYCGISEDEIGKLLEKGEIRTKRITTRGKKLELERKISELSYDDLENISLCCYWCNNAKTDEFSYAEFKEVGKEFAKIWKRRLG